METFTSSLQKLDSPLWKYHVQVPLSIVNQFTANKRRVICTINNSETFHCAIMPNGEGYWFININAKIRKKLALEVGDEMNISLKKDESEYGLPMTEEFGELLQQDTEGNKLFQELTPGKQRNLLYIAAQVKSPDKRLQRAIAIVEHLKGTQGKIDFKVLNAELKLKRNRNI